MLQWLKSLFGSAGDETPVTLESLQGKWQMVSVGKNGNFAPPAMIASAKIFMIIEGDQYTVVTKGTKGDQGSLKLDTSKKPVHFDQHITLGDDAGSVHLGIVRFKDGLLENCQGDVGCPRPKDFARKRQDGASLASFRLVRTTT